MRRRELKVCFVFFANEYSVPLLTLAPSPVERLVTKYCGRSKRLPNDKLSARTAVRRLAMNATAVIPPRANRKESRSYDQHLYKSRNLIERFFARLKQFRRIATRYDKLDIRFEAFISIAAALIWLA